jgi:hypothetical protein
MEMLALMHEADPYGHLLINGRPPTDTQLAIQAGAPEVQIPALLVELESAGVFSKTRTGVVYSRRMTREQKRRLDGEISAVSGEIEGSRRNRQRLRKETKNFTTPPVVNGVATIPPPHPDARCQNKKDSRPNGAPDDFERWYSGYPRKEGKGQARKAFAAAMRSVSLETLLAGRDRYAQACCGREPKFIRLPATWLNGEGWSDEPTTRTKQPTLGPL